MSVLDAPPCIVSGGHRILTGANHCWICGLIFKKKNRPPALSGVAQRREILAEIYGPICFYCGHTLLLDVRYRDSQWFATLDHKIPRSRGGSNHITNLCLCCKQCNNAKGDLTLEQWRDYGFPRRRTLTIGTYCPVDHAS